MGKEHDPESYTNENAHHPQKLHQTLHGHAQGDDYHPKTLYKVCANDDHHHLLNPLKPLTGIFIASLLH